VRTIGPERTQAFVAQAQEIEANGGMLIPDSSRKRTLGGIFFYLIRTQISDAEAVAINVMRRSKHKRKKLVRAQDQAESPPTAPPPPLRLLPLVLIRAREVVVGRERDRDGLTEDLGFGIPKQPFGALVPAHHLPVAVGRNNGIVGDTLDDGPTQGLAWLDRRAGHALVDEFVRP
jgi:hypothetical protein